MALILTRYVSASVRGFHLFVKLTVQKPKSLEKRLNYQFASFWCVRWTAINHIYYLHSIIQTNYRDKYHYYMYNPEEENRSQWGQTRSEPECVRSVFQELIFDSWKQLFILFFPRNTEHPQLALKLPQAFLKIGSYLSPTSKKAWKNFWCCCLSQATCIQRIHT